LVDDALFPLTVPGPVNDATPELRLDQTLDAVTSVDVPVDAQFVGPDALYQAVREEVFPTLIVAPAVGQIVRVGEAVTVTVVLFTPEETPDEFQHSME